MKKQRFFIDTEANDDNAYKEAIAEACNMVKADSEIKRIILLVHTKQTVGWFERIFDSTTVKKLFTGIQLSDCNAILKIETAKTYKDQHRGADIVITCGLDSEDVFKIDDFYSIRSIIAIPWLRELLEKWIQRWNPNELRSSKAAVKAIAEPSCIVKKAFYELTQLINGATGITNPMDNRRAKTYILALHKYEPSLDANIVGAYLVRELHWNAKHAKDIEDLISILNNGKYFHGGTKTGLQHYYKAWKELCEKESQEKSNNDRK